MVLMNATDVSPESAVWHQSSTVSMIRPLVMITEMPRATATTSATPIMSRQPSMKALTVPSSPMPATNPITTPMTMNNMDSSPNHHQRVAMAVMPRSDQGITPT